MKSIINFFIGLFLAGVAVELFGVMIASFSLFSLGTTIVCGIFSLVAGLLSIRSFEKIGEE